MKWILAWLCVGCVLLAAGTVRRLLPHPEPSDPVERLLAAARAEGRPSKFGFVDGVFIPAAAALTILVAWPFALYLIWCSLRGRTLSGASDTPVEEPPFRAGASDLGGEFAVAQVEARERVHDPLGAVPDLPFGHLNAAWLEFARQLEPGERLRAFSARHETSWGQVTHYAGYAIVRGSVVGPQFVCEQHRDRFAAGKRD